jgi:hypothetical protein
MEKLPIEYFKTINLYDVYGEKVFEKKTTSEWEEICKETFKGLEKTENHQKNMGDFVKVKKKYYQKIKKYVVLDTTFLDHKNGKVLTENVGGRSYFIKVKYSNVNSKMWIQMAMRELDEIMKHVDLGHKIKILRYKTEFTREDFREIDNDIHYQIRRWKREGIKPETNSFCLNNGFDFYIFCNRLCEYNVRKFSDLIIIHDKPLYDKDNVAKDRVGYRYDINHFHKGKPYLLTPIKMKDALIYLDYIGFGGFKIVVNKFPFKKIKKIHNTELKPLYNELDLLMNLIDFQNKIIERNEACNSISKHTGNEYYKSFTKDKWDFRDFKESKPNKFLLIA